MNEKQYCVVAANRSDGIRRAISGGMSYERANAQKLIFSKAYKKSYKYFHVAEFPYKPKRHGGGRL